MVLPMTVGCLVALISIWGARQILGSEVSLWGWLGAAALFYLGTTVVRWAFQIIRDGRLDTTVGVEGGLLFVYLMIAWYAPSDDEAGILELALRLVAILIIGLGGHVYMALKRERS